MRYRHIKVRPVWALGQLAICLHSLKTSPWPPANTLVETQLMVITMITVVMAMIMMAKFTSSSPVRLSGPGGLELLHSTSILITWKVLITCKWGNLILIMFQMILGVITNHQLPEQQKISMLKIKRGSRLKIRILKSDGTQLISHCIAVCSYRLLIMR